MREDRAGQAFPMAVDGLGAVVAVSFLVLGVVPAAGHEYKTGTGESAKQVKHKHQDQKGHATEENKPPGEHTAKPCVNDSKPLKDDEAKKAFKDWMKKELKDHFDAVPPRIAQVPGKLPTHATNCHGTTLDGGTTWVDKESAADIIANDWRDLNPGEKAAACDLLVYYQHSPYDPKNITHTAHVEEVDAAGNVKKARSKFGSGATYDHTPDAVPKSYTAEGGGHKVMKKK